MSNCIGPQGEYSEHHTVIDGICQNCGTQVEHTNDVPEQLTRILERLDETDRSFNTVIDAYHESLAEVVGLKRELAAMHGRVSALEAHIGVREIGRHTDTPPTAKTDTCEMCNTDHSISKRANVSLFKPNGKWYTDECWAIPTIVPWGGGRDVLGPFDMIHSPDAHRIDDGAIYIPAQEPWGYPHLLTGKAE